MAATAKNLYRRGGVYWWRAMIGGTTYRKSTGMKELQMAKRRASEFDAAIRAGKAGWGQKMPTVAEWIDTCVGRLYDRAKAQEVAKLRHAREAWGNRPLDSIRHSDCVAYMATRLHTGIQAQGTIWLEGVRLRRLFNMAVRDDLLTKNPWKGVRLPDSPHRSRVLSTEEEAKLRALLPADHILARLLTVILGSGLRRREVLGLRPRDVHDGVICVPKELAKGHKARSVPARGEVMAALRGQVQWEAESATTGLLEALPGTSDLRFFPFVDGGATQALQRLAKKAGIPPLTLHDLRRTFATRAATGELTGQSMPLLHLTRIMGHSSPTVTAKYYVYLQDAELIRQMTNQAPITVDGPAITAPVARESH